MKMNAIDFASVFVGSPEFYDYVDTSYNTVNFNSDTVLRMMLNDADLKGVEIVNLDSFDSESYFWECKSEIEETLYFDSEIEESS